MEVASRINSNRPVLRFSIFSLLGLTTLVAIILAATLSAATKQRRARTELMNLGIRVYYDQQRPNAALAYQLPTLNPLTRFIDQDILLSVTSVETPYLEAGALKAGALYAPKKIAEFLPDLPKLRHLRLTHSDVSNEDLKFIAALHSLESLDLSSSKLKEGPLTGLETLRLKSLSLARTRVDDRSMASLQNMTSLESLGLMRTKVTDAGLQYLNNLPNLKRLHLWRTLITEKCYRDFQAAHPNVSIQWEPLVQNP